MTAPPKNHTAPPAYPAPPPAPARPAGEHTAANGCRGYAYGWQITLKNLQCGCKRANSPAKWATSCSKYASLPGATMPWYRICRKNVGGVWKMGYTKGEEKALNNSGYLWMQFCYIYNARYPEHQGNNLAAQFEYLCDS